MSPSEVNGVFIGELNSWSVVIDCCSYIWIMAAATACDWSLNKTEWESPLKKDLALSVSMYCRCLEHKPENKIRQMWRAAPVWMLWFNLCNQLTASFQMTSFLQILILRLLWRVGCAGAVMEQKHDPWEWTHLHTSSVMIIGMDSTPFIFPSAGNTYSSISGHSDAGQWVYISSF